MYRWVISMVMVSGLLALQPVRAPVHDNMNMDNTPVPTVHVPVLTTDGDTLMTPFVNNPTQRDYQVNGPVPTRLWAVEEINGTYANMMYQYADGRRQATNFFDWATQTWAADSAGYDTTGLRNGGYGNMAVNYSNAIGYQYHFFVTFHSDGYSYQGDVQWPDTPFDPTNPSPTYTVLAGEDTNQVWPYVGFTQEGYMQQVFTDYDGHISGVAYAIIYDRSSDYTMWDGMVPIVNTGDGPWYGFYSDPFSNRVVLTYCRTSSDNHIIMLVDTMSGDMFYAGVPLQVDVSQEILNQTGTTYYVGFVGDGNPFVDKDGNVHLITFGSDGTNVAPVEIYHFFWDLQADTMGVTLIKTLTDLYYPAGVNSLVAGRSQMGQDRNNGILYAVWEEFIQEPGRFVTSSTNDTLAPTRIILAQSLDNGLTWTETVLLESDQIRDNNDWLRFPVISPVVPRIGAYDVVYWGVYDDDDPGFVWQAQGGVSWVGMLVGRKEYVSVAETPVFADNGLKLDYNLRGGNVIFNFNVPSKSPVTMKVVDISGRTVSTLFKGTAQGKHSITWNASKVPAGIYFCNFRAGNSTLSQKILLSK